MHLSLLLFDLKLINLSEKNPSFACRYYSFINNSCLISALSFSHSLLSLGLVKPVIPGAFSPQMYLAGF
jgi:hypothetical protein